MPRSAERRRARRCVPQVPASMASKEDGAKNTARRDLLLQLQANAQVSERAIGMPMSISRAAIRPRRVAPRSPSPPRTEPDGVHLLTYTPPPRGHLSSRRQAKWEAAKAFEVDAPTDVVSTPDNKFFGNFPYPYMNGKLHLGHAFSLSKLEFAASFHRMQARAFHSLHRIGRRLSLSATHNPPPNASVSVRTHFFYQPPLGPPLARSRARTGLGLAAERSVAGATLLGLRVGPTAGEARAVPVRLPLHGHAHQGGGGQAGP